MSNFFDDFFLYVRNTFKTYLDKHVRSKGFSHENRSFAPLHRQISKSILCNSKVLDKRMTSFANYLLPGTSSASLSALSFTPTYACEDFWPFSLLRLDRLKLGLTCLRTFLCGRKRMMYTLGP